MTFEMFGQLLGGIGMFLLGMQLLTNGMKNAAGRSLKKALEFATRSRLRGLVSGTLITALVQSSSAVTVATLGFVNAGLLTLGQSIAVIYGCNIGTTMVGWLVATIGFKIQISAFALPIIGMGMLLQVIGKQQRISHLGTALVGFGIFFIGLDFMRAGFDGLSDDFQLAALGTGVLALGLFVIAGFVMTFLMQASAAVMAIALSLVYTDSITMSAAAAVVIGANLGTTTTAILASIGATANAKRISAAHVAFNLLTGCVGLVLLMLLAGQLDALNPQQYDLVILLALFHTLFNVMGVVLMWPLTTPLERFLLTRFRSQEEDEARPRFIDKTIINTPTLAIEAISLELSRVSQLSSRLAREAISSERNATAKLEQQAKGIQYLIGKIAEFNQEIGRQNLSPDIHEVLPISMRVMRYYSEVTRLSAKLPEFYSMLDQVENKSVKQAIFNYQKQVIALIDLCEIKEGSSVQGTQGHQLVLTLEKEYQTLKSLLLEQSTLGHLSSEDSIALLDAVSHINRLAEQVEKGARYWSYATPAAQRAPLAMPTAATN
ncbi:MULTISPECIES: Na/Pi cotransporter family protein [Nitrincola]|uniref:Na/Pi-cotransporter II-related protein n=1 Tax=Nitrincola nitratireducens TaxID=1229521 RepID=W9V678_9GAMM|nr:MULTISPECIES: Na/Pi symporter [Nitrincola]EXJ11627.1 Na/Pi-cotransporter II-related protein [Nitrincola nitratireducens]